MGDEAGGFFAVATFMLGIVVGSQFFRGPGPDGEREKAIEAGVGRWVIDSKTGESNFVYGVFPLPPERSKPCN